MTWRQHVGGFDNPINPEYEQEARLVEQSRAGSERAFSALLARYQQPVFRLIFFLVGDEDEARDLTRVALKHALHRMPRVPAGYSIRPWLLRVASLVALDAVRARSDSPESLVASLQLPAPAGPPTMVDATPMPGQTGPFSDSVEMLAQSPETAIADAWDRLPVSIERELVRRLLAVMPEGDSELLALGVVGQVPTRDLAAMAGTSQRSIRRRIARALILFQSHYQMVRTEALPAAPVTKELPAAVVSGVRPLAAVQRGFAGATGRLRRGFDEIRQGLGSVEAQERLQTLRHGDVPSANMVGRELEPATRPIEHGDDWPTVILQPPASDVAPTMIDSDVTYSPGPAPESEPGVLAHAFEPPDWGHPVPLMPDLPESVAISEAIAAADTMTLPLESLPSEPEETMPAAEVAAAETSEVVVPLSPVEPALTVQRVLPRYGPPTADDPDDDSLTALEHAPERASLAESEPQVEGELEPDETVTLPATPLVDIAANETLVLAGPLATDDESVPAGVEQPAPDEMMTVPVPAFDPDVTLVRLAHDPPAFAASDETLLRSPGGMNALAGEDATLVSARLDPSLEPEPQSLETPPEPEVGDASPAVARPDGALAPGERDDHLADTQEMPVIVEAADVVTAVADNSASDPEPDLAIPSEPEGEKIRAGVWVDPGDLGDLAALARPPALDEENEPLTPFAPPEGGFVLVAAAPPGQPAPTYDALPDVTAIAGESSDAIDPADLVGIVDVSAPPPADVTGPAAPVAPDVEWPATPEQPEIQNPPRQVTRPMPRLDRSVVDPPREW